MTETDSERRFLVACRDGRGVASMWIDPNENLQSDKDIASFMRRYAKHDLRIVNGAHMKELML